MKRRTRLLLIPVLLVAAVLGTLLMRRSGAAGASALSASPEGWLAARTYLERRGSRVLLRDRPLDEASAKDALVLTFPWQGMPSPEELDALKRRFSSGGTIVFAYSGRTKGLGEQLAGETLDIDLAAARGHPPLSPRRWWAFVSAEWRLKADEEFAPDGGAREVVISAPDWVPTKPKGAEILYRGDQRLPAIFSYERGRGRVVVLPAEALSNSRLGNPGNADLLESLRVALGPVIAFDEYHHGLVSSGAVAESGSAPSLDLLLSELLVLYLLCAWALARRFGPSWQEPPEIASSTSAFLLGLGGLHRKLRHSAPAALRLIEGAQSYDPRVSVPPELQGVAFDANEHAFLEIARVVTRLQRRGRSDGHVV